MNKKDKLYSVADHPRYLEAAAKAKELRHGLNEARKEMGLDIKDVVAMSQGNDPYWMTTGKILKAYWAEEVMNNIVLPFLTAQKIDSIHLRDIHYTLTASEQNLTWQSKRYLNTDAHWKDLIEAFANARYLGLIDWRIIRDNKNDFAHRTSYREPKTFRQAIKAVRENLKPEIVIKKLIRKPFEGMLNIWKFQPVHVEIWAEKDLALMEKVAEDWNLNTVVGEGEISITQVYLAAQRISRAGKPARIAYISDCDVVGSNMVKAMARKMEYILKSQMGKKTDVRVIPLMATPQQVEELGLPVVPMKAGKKQAYNTRVENWLDTRNMDGAVEINALHAMHPNFFKDTLENFIRDYVDVEKWNEVIDMRKEIPNWIIGHINDENLDLDTLEEMVDDVSWDDVESDHNGRIKDMGKSNMDYSDSDEDHPWLLNTKLDYGRQLNIYKEFDKGDL